MGEADTRTNHTILLLHLLTVQLRTYYLTTLRFINKENKMHFTESWKRLREVARVREGR
jgi:hypothetical protein